MKVDLNNLRKQAAYSLDKVIQILNAGIMPEYTYERITIDDKETRFEGNLLVSTEDLEKHIDQLRGCIWATLCVYEEDNPDLKELSEEVEKTGGIAQFNPKEDENN